MEKQPSSSSADASWRSGQGDDNTFSFILRVGPGYANGQGSSRRHFRVEDVAAGRHWHFTDYASAAECLSMCVQKVIHRLDSQ